MADQDLSELLSDLDTEVSTRGDRFERIADTDPDDPDLREALKPTTAGDDESIVGTLGRVVDLLGTQAVTNYRIFIEVATSLGFDLRAVHTLAQHVANQQSEIERLSREVEELRAAR